MNTQFSVYLDLCRFIAAVVVVLTHLLDFNILAPQLNYLVPENGRDAVIVFFVLSGLVIYYTAHKAPITLSAYITARATRIYSVALPVILLAVCVDLIGLQFNPENYTGLYQYAKLYIYVPFHLAFLGEIWTISEQPFTVPPYWSLGYEVWYYALFALLFFYRGLKRVLLFAVLFLAVGYKLWLLFPIWLAGVLLLWLIEHTTPKQWLAWALFLAPLLLYPLYKFTGADQTMTALGEQIWPFAALSLGSAAKYGSDYAVCVLFFSHLYGARFVRLDWLLRWQRPITLLASYTFTLYLVHAPVMKTIEHNMRLDTESIGTSLAVLALVAWVTYVLGSLTEKRKHLFKPMVQRGVALLKHIVLWLRLGTLLRPNR